MGLNGLRVLTLESRRSNLVQNLIEEQGGECFNAPSVRERPMDANPQAIQFAKDLIAGRYDMVIFTTGAESNGASQRKNRPTWRRKNLHQPCGCSLYRPHGPNGSGIIRGQTPNF